VQSGDNKPEPISMGIIVNFTNQTVHGLRPFPVAIIDMNEVTVSFGGQWGTTTRISGSIDRVTGDFEATSTTMNAKTGNISPQYALKCKPTQRMF
jgi:hypothetical protein